MNKEDAEMDSSNLEQMEKNKNKIKSEGKNDEAIEDEAVIESEEIEKTYEELEEDNKALSDKMMRALAETENIRKKFFKEKKDAEIYGGTKLARDILSVLDNLNRALDSVDEVMRENQNAFLEGIELTRKELLSVFSSHEINELAPETGERFDPKFHQAMFEGPHPEIEKGDIIQVMANGFTIGERLLRAAQVGVSSGILKNEKKEDNSD